MKMVICADSVFNTSLSWNANEPQFTNCFQLLLVLVPCVFLWLVAIPYIMALYYRGSRSTLPWSRISRGKLVLSILLTLLCLVDCGYEIFQHIHRKEGDILKILSPAILSATFILTIVVLKTERKFGVISSPVLFPFFFFVILCGLVPIYSIIKRFSKRTHGEALYLLVAYSVYYLLSVISLIFNCISDTSAIRHSENDNPYDVASVLSRSTFWWLNKTVVTAFLKNLSPNDVFRLSKSELVDRNYKVFTTEWETQKRLRPLSEENREAILAFRNINSDDRAPLLQDQDDNITQTSGSTSSLASQRSNEGPAASSRQNTSSETESEPGSEDDVKFGPPEGSPRARRAKTVLLISLIRVFGPTLLFSWLFKLFYDILNFANPLLLRVLLDYTKNKDEPAWHGWIYAATYTLLASIATVCYNHCHYISNTLALRIRSTLTSMVFKKVLRISNEARGESTAGEIVNLMSVDTERVAEVVGELWFMWSTVIQLTIGIWLLWEELGPATLSGLAVLVLFIPVNGIVMAKLETYEEKEMESKDERIKILGELLNGMKIIKLYAWEMAYEERVRKLRNLELSFTRKSAYGWSIIVIVWCIAPYLVLVASFATYLYTGEDHVLTARRAFVSLTLFNMLQMPMTMFPEGITRMINAYVSIKRLSRFMDGDDIEDDVSEKRPKEDGKPAIIIEDGIFTWKKDVRPVLQNINLTVNQGQLVAVLGSVGCGKSSLVSAVLGELLKLDGRVIVRGSVAYVPQETWIQNMTVEENIRFGLPMNGEWYEKVIDACGLRPDLENFPAGDQTEIGERGINLSGGQKQRISLARAVYCRSDIYVLDDPLSAVDATVGKHIFAEVIGPRGLLSSTARLFITNNISLLAEASSLAVMDDGRIVESGTYKDLMRQKNSRFAKYVRGHSDDDNAMMARLEESMSSQDSDDKTKRRLRKQSSSESQKSSRRSLMRIASQESNNSGRPRPSSWRSSNGRLTDEECLEVGKVSWRDYMAMLRARGLCLSFFMLMAYFVYTANNLAAGLWLSKWTDDPLFANYTPGTSDANRLRDKTDFYMGIYCLFGVGELVTVSVFAIFEVVTGIRASKRIHRNLIARLLRAPMRFFDMTPVGRILNRFDRDMEVVDHDLFTNINNFIESFMAVISSIIIISITLPLFLAFSVPLIIIYYFIQKFYIPISRQARRIDSITRSPLITYFTESIQGAQVIRAYRQNRRFVKDFDDMVDNNARFTYLQTCSEQWLALRLEMLSILVVLITIILAVVERNNLSPGLVGLAVSYALQVTENLNFLIEQVTDLETNAVAIERIEEYSKIEQEEPWETDNRPPENWPTQGDLVFRDYSMRYRPGLDFALHGIDVHIRGGEEIGIGGRSGAGKSSLTLALFRLVEAAEGNITIDGLSIDQFGLHQVRKNLTILPQEPTLFSGTLRHNVDPMEERDESEIWCALDRSHLSDWARNLDLGLDHDVGEGGSHLSVGQRQLICLSRALLHKSKVLLLDEATASVDLDTDQLVMETIRTEFEDSTILVIAHRLSTIMEMDKVMVLERGEVNQFDTPGKLLRDKKGIFYRLAADAGLV